MILRAHTTVERTAEYARDSLDDHESVNHVTLRATIVLSKIWYEKSSALEANFGYLNSGRLSLISECSVTYAVRLLVRDITATFLSSTWCRTAFYHHESAVHS